MEKVEIINEEDQLENEDNQIDVSLELKHIKKDYYVNKKPFTAIKDLSLVFPKKGFVAILGESGCGKSTLLNILGGLDRYTSGDLLINGVSTKQFNDADWDKYRNTQVGFIFQSYNLISHFNLLQNVEVPLKLAGINQKEREERAKAALEKVGLGDSLHKIPNQLSGGQQQRVAIARALINNPSIILADEPTGALDSATSIQVMELIKEAGKECCVIMVTHNEKLAKKYADRIITMSDGEAISDTSPIEVGVEIEKPKTKEKRTGMSFVSALHSSFKNVLTKKTRTALTAVACSFGIIGVALVLATSNGFSLYVKDVETSVASSVPITISPTVVSYKSNNQDSYTRADEFPKDNNIRVYDSSSSSYVVHQNTFTKEYIDALKATMTDKNNPAYGTVMSVMENRNGLDFHFLTKDGMDETAKITSINQYASASSLGAMVSSVTSLPTTIIHELYGDEESLSSMYDVIDGKFPENDNELVLVVDRYNRVDFSTLKKLGVFPSNSTYETLNANEKQISFSSLIYDGEGDNEYKEYKCYTNSSYYKKSMETKIIAKVSSYKNIKLEMNGEDSKFVGEEDETEIIRYKTVDDYDEVYNNDEYYNPIKCKIVGVLRPTKESYLTLMPSSLAYLPGLKETMAKDYSEGGAGYNLAQEQKDNWYVPRHVSKNANDPKNASNDGIESLNASLKTLMKSYSEKEDGEATISTNTLSTLFNNVARYQNIFCIKQMNEGGGYTCYAPSSNPKSYLSWCQSYGATFNQLEINNDSNNAALFLLMLTSGEFFSKNGESNFVDVMALANSYSLITSVLVFPKSLSSKDVLLRYMDSLNEGKRDSEKIVYSDIMSDFTGSLGTMINVISAVLIVFASISLVVSSVMTAIITYVSVVERTKEIGILRACGARKKDVGRLFEAECVIIGLVAGLIGVLFTVLACIPINAIIDYKFPGNNLSSIAKLNPLHALILLALSILLSYLSGLIPSRMAANKDPVTCLRSDQ